MRSRGIIVIAASPAGMEKRLRAASDVESRRRIRLGLQMSFHTSKRAARLGRSE